MTAHSASAGIAFWGVVSDESEQVIEFFPARWQAEVMLEKVLRDEPDWREVLRVEKIELRTGRRTSGTGLERPCETLVAWARQA